LVTFTVAERRGTASGFSKRAVKGTGELGGIRHQSAFISKSCIQQSLLDTPDPAVHHVTGCHTMSAGFRISNSDLGDTLSGRRLVDCTIMVQNATVAV
jgi:hypothetical protein